jgi:hypothetical protein
MDDLLVLLERYSPGYSARVQGVEDWRLDELEEAFGRTLPRFYRQFCQIMGTDAGPLLAHVHAYEPRDDVATIYRVFPDRRLPPRRFLYVFGDPSMDSQHYWLDLERPSPGGEDCWVVRMPFGSEGWETRVSSVYVSLREMLFAWAMMYLRLPTFPHQVGYYRPSGERRPGTAGDAEELARIFERLGFTRLPYPRHCQVFERSDAGIFLYRAPASPGLSFDMGVQDPREGRRVETIIEENTGMVRS